MSKVRLTMSLPRLAQLACLVDKYCFHELAVPFARGWVDSVTPADYNQLTNYEFAEYMTIYYCFNRSAEFEETNQQLINFRSLAKLTKG